MSAVRPATTIGEGAPHRRAGARIFVCDDDPSTRFRVSQELQARRLRIAGSAGEIATALSAIRATQPDVVVFDHATPGFELSDAVSRVRARAPTAKIVVYSHSSDALRDLAGDLGHVLAADAYVGKDKPPDRLCDAPQIGRAHV